MESVPKLKFKRTYEKQTLFAAATVFVLLALLTHGCAASASDFVRVEGGTFMMGTPGGGPSGVEAPVRSVTVSSFYMSRLLVTQREWREVMGTNPSHFAGDNRPVESVSWFDAVEFANARSLLAGLTPAYTINGTGTNRTVTWNREANGYRLPTEAEWEFAARGGRDFFLWDLVFSGSNTAGYVAWYDRNSWRGTREVGTRSSNDLWIYDMSGNVGEWVWDWKGLYPSAAQTNPTGAPSGAFRVIRGGGWGDTPESIRPTARNGGNPSNWSNAIGFRLVRS